MESILKSRITLASGRIEQVGQYLYVRFLKRRLIPEDLCADLYEQLTKKLKRFRDLNPDIKKVDKSFVYTCANWVAKTLCRRQKKRDTQEKTLVELLKTEVNQVTKPASSRLHKKYEKQIYTILKKRIISGKLKRRHLLYYVLYHAAETRLPFAVQLLKTAGLRTPENIRRLKRVRRQIRRKTEARTNLLAGIISKKHSIIMDSQWALQQAADRKTKKLEREKIKQASLARQAACDKLCKVRIVPSMKSLSISLGPAPSVISYGIRKVESIIKKEVTP